MPTECSFRSCRASVLTASIAWPAESDDLESAALAYETELRLAFAARGDEPPTFDLIWLGMGRDGHTASLFPGSPALDERERSVLATWVPSLRLWRMTLTLPVLLAGRETLFVVTGADKADVFAAVRTGSRDLPAARVTGDNVIWLVDEAVAGRAA